MPDPAEVLAIIIVAWAVASTVAALVLWRRLTRMNRVAMRRRTPAPLMWLWSPWMGARLHRRLVAAVTPIDPDRPGSALPMAEGTDSLRREILDAAVALDERIVRAQRLPRTAARRDQLAGAAAEVAVIEDLSRRIAGNRGTGAAQRATELPGLTDLAERVILLEQARRALEERERAPGGQLDAAPETSTRVSSEALARPSSMEDRAAARPSRRSST